MYIRTLMILRSYMVCGIKPLPAFPSSSIRIHYVALCRLQYHSSFLIFTRLFISARIITHRYTSFHIITHPFLSESCAPFLYDSSFLFLSILTHVGSVWHVHLLRRDRRNYFTYDNLVRLFINRRTNRMVYEHHHSNTLPDDCTNILDFFIFTYTCSHLNTQFT